MFLPVQEDAIFSGVYTVRTLYKSAGFHVTTSSWSTILLFLFSTLVWNLASVRGTPAQPKNLWLPCCVPQLSIACLRERDWLPYILLLHTSEIQVFVTFCSIALNSISRISKNSPYHPSALLSLFSLFASSNLSRNILRRLSILSWTGQLSIGMRSRSGILPFDHWLKACPHTFDSSLSLSLSVSLSLIDVFLSLSVQVVKSLQRRWYAAKTFVFSGCTACRSKSSIPTPSMLCKFQHQLTVISDTFRDHV